MSYADLQKGHIFYPNTKTLSDVTRILYESGPMDKASILLEAKTDHDKLNTYIKWLEKKYLIEPVLDGCKIKWRLTAKGKQVAILLSNDGTRV